MSLSIIFPFDYFLYIIFSGFKSLCIIPFEWTEAIAYRRLSIKIAVFSSDNGGLLSKYVCKSPPFKNSVTKQTWLLVSYISWSYKVP